MNPQQILLLCCLFYFEANANSSDSSSYYVQQALQLKQAGKYKEANHVFQRALSFNSADVNTRIQYGISLAEEKKFSLAKEQFKKILEFDPKQPIALLKLCVVSAALNNWDDVVKYGAVVQETGDATLLYLLGKAYFLEEEYDLSQQVLHKLLVTNPVHHEGLAMLARVNVEMGDYKKAGAFYNQALAIKPEDPNLLYEYSLIIFILNKPKDAVSYMELAATKGYKADLDYYENLGLAYLAFDIEKGIEVLQNVLKRKPNNPEIQLQIANAYYKDKKFEIAAERYYNMFQHDPSNSRALYMMGMALQKKGEKVRGIGVCEQALKMDPSLAEHKVLGYAR